MGNFTEALISNSPKEGDKNNRWIFTEITEKTFHWLNETTQKDGTIKVWCEVYAARQ